MKIKCYLYNVETDVITIGLSHEKEIFRCSKKFTASYNIISHVYFCKNVILRKENNVLIKIREY